MDIHSLVLLLDQQAKSEVDNRLHFIQNDGANQQTTRTVVYAPDPLKDISNPLESIMTVPTDPPSKKVQLIGGHFFANGKLYAFPGMTTDEIIIDPNQDTYVLTGIRIDPRTDRTTFYCQTYYGEYPFMDGAVVPSALIKIPKGQSRIVSDFIIDLRPFIHYNVSLPEDRAVINISCINPGESVAFQLMKNHTLPPIMNFYAKAPAEGVSTITHEFKSMDDIILLAGEEPQYAPEYEGITLKNDLRAHPVEVPNTPNVLVVSALTGRDTNSGSMSYPLRTLGAAVTRLNGSGGSYDTIYVKQGIYAPSNLMDIQFPCSIIGENPLNCIVRFTAKKTLIKTNAEVTFRTLQFQCYDPTSTLYPATVLSYDTIRFYNCLFKQASSKAIQTFLNYDTTLIMSNCVVHNPYYNGTLYPLAPSMFYAPTITNTSPITIVLSSMFIGPWAQSFSFSPTDRDVIDIGDGSSLDIEDTTTYYPVDGGGLKHEGNGSLTGSNKDGTINDIGLYGGMYAALFRLYEYSVSDSPVFKYAYHTMYSPVIARFVDITVVCASVTGNTPIYGCVSFDGGHHWLIWDEYLGAWKKLKDLTEPETWNKADDLANRLVAMGPIQTRGEIVFAWSLKTSIPNLTPILKGVNITVKADSNSYVPISPEKFSVLVAGDTVLITNNSGEKLLDTVIVAY